jgi:hypothetical protein
MEVTFSWDNTKGPDEVVAITLMTDAVPRIGELVEVDTRLPLGSGRVEPVRKSGRVLDVVWRIGDECSYRKATVMLGA